MNLHAIVRGAITSVNPDVAALLRVCTGTATDAVGRRTPTYAADLSVRAQVQDLSQRDIQHLDSLNVQGSQKVIYLYGQVSGMRRGAGTGNDMILLNGGAEVWAVTAVLEQWGSDWVKVAVTVQVGSASAGGSLDFSQSGNSQYAPSVG